MTKQIKKSKARKSYWSKIPKEVRSQKMRELVLKRYAKLSPAQRSEQARKQVMVRWNKKKELSTSEVVVNKK